MMTASKPLSPAEARMVQRASWLHTLSQSERDALVELPLREVDARFESWQRRAGDRRASPRG